MTLFYIIYISRLDTIIIYVIEEWLRTNNSSFFQSSRASTTGPSLIKLLIIQLSMIHIY